MKGCINFLITKEQQCHFFRLEPLLETVVVPKETDACKCASVNKQIERKGEKIGENNKKAKPHSSV